MKIQIIDWLFKNNRLRYGLMVLIFLAGLGIRLFDLDDLPLDFHPTRQLFTAIIARGYYYQMMPHAPSFERTRAIQQFLAEEKEPPSIDWLAAVTYRLVGRIDLWYPRFYSVLFWLAGGIAVYWIAKTLTSPAGGILSLGFYLFAPYGIIASRSFQPDPMMTSLTLFAWACMLRWARDRGWKWAIAAGVLAGAAMMVKALAVFTVLGGMLAAILMRGFKPPVRSSLRQTILDPQMWVMALVAAAPVVAWTIYGFWGNGSLGVQFALRFFPNLWIDPVFYLRLQRMIERVTGLLPFFMALLGWFFFRSRQERLFTVGLWVGYLMFVFVFAYYSATHSYYHIALVPIAAITLAPFGQIFAEKISESGMKMQTKAGLALILLIGTLSLLWSVRDTLHKANYRGQDRFWAHLGEVIRHDGRTVALTQDYGFRLAYWGWTTPVYWPYGGDLALRQLAGHQLPSFQHQFAQLTANNNYFLVTDLEEFHRQRQLKEMLEANYPVFSKGEGYIIYNLRESKR